jgi:hypothetical protein
VQPRERLAYETILKHLWNQRLSLRTARDLSKAALEQVFEVCVPLPHWLCHPAVLTQKPANADAEVTDRQIIAALRKAQESARYAYVVHSDTTRELLPEKCKWPSWSALKKQLHRGNFAATKQAHRNLYGRMYLPKEVCLTGAPMPFGLYVTELSSHAGAPQTLVSKTSGGSSSLRGPGTGR